MKISLLTVAFALVSAFIFAQSNDHKPHYYIIGIDSLMKTPGEHMQIEPVYPGLRDALYQNINKRIEFSKKDIADNLKGTEIITFVVDETGKLTKLNIKKSLSADVDKEIIRIVNQSLVAHWKPAVFDRKNVSAMVELPIDIVVPE